MKPNTFDFAVRHGMHMTDAPWDGRTMRQSAKGRVCGQDGCDTILSCYNHTPLCAVHQREVAEIESVGRALRWEWR